MTLAATLLSGILIGLVNGFLVGVVYVLGHPGPSLPVAMVRPTLPWERKKRRTFGLGK